MLAIKDKLRAQGILPSRGSRQTQRPLITQKAREDAKRRAAQRAQDNEADVAERLRKARWLWEISRPAENTIVQTYLGSRAIFLERLPATLRFLAPNPPKHPLPGMIAGFGIADEPEPGLLYLPSDRIRGLHLTYLLPDGSGKAQNEAGKEKIMVGSSTGWPIVLAPPNDGLALVIGEGVETVLWGYQASGMGAWAAGTAGRLPALADKVPSYIESVTLAVDGDPEGESRSHDLAKLLADRGFEVLLCKAVSHGA